MPKKFDPKNKEVLVSSQRYDKLDPQRVMSLLPLLIYQSIADIGCGPGYFTVPLAKYLFDGKVFALDVQQEMLDAARKEIESIHLTNVQFDLSQENKLPLEDECLDGAFAAFMIHETEKPRIFLKEINRCLRKGGWLALLEWHKVEMEEGPPLEERIEEAKLHEITEKAGFRHASRHSLNDSQYMLLMRK